MTGASSPLYPVFLRLAGRDVLVVGGGPVAASKLAALRDSGATVTVVAPWVCQEILDARVTIRLRPFRPADLDGVWLVVAAATPEVNREVAERARARRLFVNAVDDPANASVYLGGTLRRGGVTISISTDGQAPALAGLLREGLEAVLPEELDEWMAIARRTRRVWRAQRVPMAARRPLLLQALNARYDRRRAQAPPIWHRRLRWRMLRALVRRARARRARPAMAAAAEVRS